MTVNIGDKYLSISIMGKNGIQTAAFKNEKKTEGSKDPDYIGNGIAVWIMTKKDKQTQENKI